MGGRNVTRVLLEPELIKQLFILGRVVFLKCQVGVMTKGEGQNKHGHSLWQELLKRIKEPI